MGERDAPRGPGARETELQVRSDADQPLVEEQIRYYRCRAPEYDEWFYRRGRYDQGPDHTRRWRQEIDEVRESLDAASPSGRMLELACGTGLWTGQLSRYDGILTAIDASHEVIARNRARVRSGAVRYRQCDIFRWEPDEAYDFIFFGFWLSHVPLSRFEGFWERLRAALAPGGTIFLVDSRGADVSRRPPSPDRARMTERRALNDGRTFEIVKVFYSPRPLTAQLEPLGWRADLRVTDNFFIYGTVSPA